MQKISAFILPLITAFIIIFGLFKGIKVFDCFLGGAKRGLNLP